MNIYRSHGCVYIGYCKCTLWVRDRLMPVYLERQRIAFIHSARFHHQGNTTQHSFSVSEAAKMQSALIPTCKNCLLAKFEGEILFKNIRRRTLLKAIRRFSAGNLPKRSRSVATGANYFRWRRGLHGSVALAQQVKFDLPQVSVPETDLMFKGMDTDFPCLTRNKAAGPEPAYDRIVSGYKLYTSEVPFELKYNKAVLPELNIAYETWGKLNEDRSNAVVIHAGLSASSHARSHKDNTREGWWEKFVGPGCAVDTNKFFVICTNTLGGCYGSSGPSSTNPVTGKQYATTFPVIGIEDMVNAQFHLLDYLGIDKLHASVGSSLGGMCSLMATALYPERVGRMISISSCCQSHPSSIAMRYLQRKCIMTDPNWRKGHYYSSAYPKMGMKLAREIATMTYRSGPEWDDRFGRKRIEPKNPPTLCPTFLIENYIEHQGEQFSTKFDPNSLLYISKAMDIFDIAENYNNIYEGLARVKCPVMVIGVKTDILFPISQQRELADMLQKTGNSAVTYYELNSIYGHDTFLLDLNGVGAAVKGFLQTRPAETGWLTKHKKTDDHQRDRRHF